MDTSFYSEGYPLLCRGLTTFFEMSDLYTGCYNNLLVFWIFTFGYDDILLKLTFEITREKLTITPKVSALEILFVIGNLVIKNQT